MPIYAKRNPWMQQGGGALDNAGTLYQGILAAKVRQAQQQYQQRLMELHGKQWQAQANLDDARRLEIGQKMVQNKAISDLADIVGQSQAMKKSVQSASLGNNPEVLATAATLLRNSGMAPEGQFDISRSDLSDLLQGLSSSSASRIATSTPESATQLLQPRDVGPNSASYSGLGDLIGVGPTTPTKPVVVKGALVDPDSGKAIYTAPEAVKTVNTPANSVTSIVGQDGSVTPAFTNTLQKPFALGNSVKTLVDPITSTLSTNDIKQLQLSLKAEAMRQLGQNASQGTQEKVAKSTGFTAPSSTDSQIYTPTTQDEYDSIPSGATYVHPDGTKRVKK